LLIDFLDKKAETVSLSTSERGELRDANIKLAKLRRGEESKWAQRAKVKYIQEGENNTKYFNLIANSKHRRKIIYQLEQDEGTIVGQDNLKVEYYKNLFGPPTPNNFSMRESNKANIPQLSVEENKILVVDFTEQ
jgi:hypothetical protein